MPNALDLMINAADLRCSVCSEPRSVGCDCWTKCDTRACTWSYRKGTHCPNCLRNAMPITEDERKVLAFLDHKMHAPAAMIGEHLKPWKGRTKRGYAIIGNKIARQLWFGRFLVTWLRDVDAYRITPLGRAALLAKDHS